MRKLLGLIVALCMILAVSHVSAQGVFQLWDFEAGIGDWTSAGGGNATAELSTEQAVSDSQSVKLTGKDDHNQINFRNDVYEDVQVGDVIRFNFWISSADLALVNGIQVFWQDAGWAWHSGAWTAPANIIGDAWNTIQYQVDALTAPLQTFGFQLNELDAASIPVIYIDDAAILRAGDAGVVVDGMKDAFYTALTGPDDGYLQLQAFHGNNNGFADDNTDLSAKIWTAWDDSCFYYYEEVTDEMVASTSAANSWQNDQFEIKVDPVPDGVTNTIVGVDFSALDASHGAAATPAGGVRKLTANGYVLEAAIPWERLANGAEVIAPAEGAVFGLGMHNHDNDAHLPVTREATTQWAAVMLDQVWNTPAYLGTATFLADNKLQLVPTNNFTPGNTNDLPYDGSVPTAIAIDGEKDPLYYTLTGPDDGYLQLQAFHGNNNGTALGNADLSAKVWTSWDADYFYIYEEVTDDTISMSSNNTYQNDCIEIKVDPQATDSVANSVISFDMTAMDTTGGITGVATIDSSFRTLTANGYILEAAIPWTDMVHSNGEAVTAAIDSVFGLCIQNHDNDNTAGRRDATVQWAAVLMDQAWNQPKYLATAKFLADNKLQLIPSNNMTGATNDLPYDGSVPAIVVDGVKDPFYKLLTGPDDGYVQIGPWHWSQDASSLIGEPDNAADLSAKLWSSWDDTWFYLYAEITDDTIGVVNTTNFWRNDGLEIKLDGVADDSTETSVSFGTSMTAIDTPDVRATGLTNSLSEVPDGAGQYARAAMTGGYILEFAILLSELGGNEPINAAIGEVFGMGVNIIDNDGILPTSNRQAAILWAAELSDHIWNWPRYHGTIEFLDDDKLSWVALNNMTGRGHGIPYDGTYVPPNAVDGKPAIPKEFGLYQNYPNPFNPTTTITYTLPTAADVQLVVYDVLGREVMTLVNEKKEAGAYHVNFDGMNVSSGIYFYRLKAGDNVETQKMMLLK